MSGLVGELPGESLLINDSVIKPNWFYVFQQKLRPKIQCSSPYLVNHPQQQTLNISNVVASDVTVCDMHLH